MKILVVGGTRGNIDKINEYADKSKSNLVLCTGDFGIFYRKEKSYKLPKSFLSNEFPDYLEGHKKFVIPTFTVRGPHDNISLCKSLINGNIKVDNFTLIDDGSCFSIDNDKSELPISSIIIGGVGGSYSPKHYNKNKLVGNEKRHFNYNLIEKIKKNKIHILLMHDLIGNGSQKEIVFSNLMFDFLRECSPFYCFVGKYRWWSCSPLQGTHLVTLPYIQRGYFIIDTDNWNAEAVRFDLNIGGLRDSTHE